MDDLVQQRRLAKCGKHKDLIGMDGLLTRPPNMFYLTADDRLCACENPQAVNGKMTPGVPSTEV